MLAEHRTMDMPPHPTRIQRPFHWRVLGVLMVASCLGAVALLPYLATLIGPALASSGRPLGPTLALALVQPLVLSALAIFVGLRLGHSVGLGAPLLEDWLYGDPAAARRIRASVGLSIVTGLVVAGVILALEFAVFAPNLASTRPAVTSGPPPWQGLLASLYGAIDEEILLRLGLMSLLTWLGARLTRTFPPRPGVLWTATALAGVLFGIGHLPAAAAVGPLTLLAITRVLLLNGAAGVGYGWLYWRHGLVAAMLAHFSTDLVIHAVAPTLLGAT